MLLSGGATLNDYNANLNSAAYLNSPTYDPMAAQAAFIAANGPAWSPPPAMPAFDLGISYQALPRHISLHTLYRYKAIQPPYLHCLYLLVVVAVSLPSM